MSRPHVLLGVDAGNLYNRAFFASAATRNQYARGGGLGGLEETVRGMLVRLLQWVGPTLAFVAEDRPPYERRWIYRGYKLRPDEDPGKPTTPEFNEYMARWWQRWGWPVVGLDGWEADDILATKAREASLAGVPSLLLTRDTDLLQLVREGCSVLWPRSGKAREGEDREEVADPEWVQAYMGVPPHLVVDYKAIMGDESDCIPRIARSGWGPKATARLLLEFGSLDATYDNLDRVPERERSWLVEGRKQALCTRQLARLRDDLALPRLGTRALASNITWG